MARYNTVTSSSATTGATSFSAPQQGLLTTFTGTAPYTVTLASPVLYVGISQSFFNSTGGTVTLTSPSGTIKGPGFTAAASQTIPNAATYTLTSDGTDYVVTNNEGGPQVATTFTTSSTLTANGAVAFNPSNANVVISPTGTGTVTINPATVGSINRVNIGGTVAGDATFGTVTLNTSLTGTGTIDGGTF